MSNMACWIFVFIVTVTIENTCDANYIEESKSDERNPLNDGNYLVLVDEMRALRDTVRGQGGILEAMEKEIENLKSEVGMQKRQNIMMKTVVKRQQISLNAQRKLIEKLKRQNMVFETFLSKIRDTDCKETTKKGTKHGDLEATFETQPFQVNQIASSSNGHNTSRKHGRTIYDTKTSAKSALPTNGRGEPFGHFGNRIDKNDQIRPNTLPGNISKAKKRLVIGGGSGGIAFSAYLNHTISSMASGQTVKCEATLLNDGGAYNVHTGVFTVPKTGVYLFFFTIHAYHNHTFMFVDLTVDNRYMADAAVYTTENVANHIESASNAAILRLTQGQSVWLTAFPDKGFSAELYSGYNRKYVTFSGVFLY